MRYTSAEYQDAIQALYTLSYGVKFAIKRSGGANYKVSPLEGLWWAADLEAFTAGDKAAWDWTAMIRQPDELTGDLLAEVAADAARKRALAALGAVRLETFTEGLAAQILHVGPYADEAPTIERLHAFLTEQGLHFDGRRQKHHEIYLGDPRRAAPERLRTILRQPATGTPPAAAG